jgi:putative MATE family efflux protein
MLGFISVVFAVVGLFGSRFLLEGVMGTKGLVAEVGVPYLAVTMTGSCSMFLLLHLITIQRALGSSKAPISMLVFANAANLLLAVVLVFGPGPAPPVFAWGPPIAEALGLPRLELEGAAWATVLARSTALVPAFVLAFMRHGLFQKDSRQGPDPGIMRRIWDLGWPTSSQLVVRILAIVAVVAFANHRYTTDEDQSVGAALSVVLRWETMALFVGLGWGSASQTFMGQNLGAGQPQRALLSGWYISGYNSVMMFLFAAACFTHGRELVSVFTDDEAVIQAALGYFAWVAPSYVGLGIGIVLGSAIQGAGASRRTFVIDLAVILLLQLPLCFLVVNVWQASVTGLWQVIAFTHYAFALIYLFYYRRGTFLRTQLP